MSIINVVPSSKTTTIEQIQVSTILFNISDTSCGVQVTTLETYTTPSSSVATTTLILAGTDFTDNINIAGIKTWICSQLGLTES